MVIPEDQVLSKKKVGKAGGQDVVHIKLRGGLHIMAKGPRRTILGAASHRAVARHLAQQYEPDIEWTELSKSEHVDMRDFAEVLPYYADLTAELRRAQGQE